MSNLVIVESPTKAKTLSRFLGSGYELKATMGHVSDLPEKELGIDIEHDFAPKYVAIAKKKEGLSEIKKLAGEAETIFLATDPDREGEAIAWHVEEMLKVGLKKKKTPFKRITFHEITSGAIKEALEHPREVDLKLVDAQQARRVLDRLVGYKLSPLLWKKVKRGLSAGRVQSVAVRLVVEKEREITAFKPTEYWEIFVELEKESDRGSGQMFWVKLVKVGDGKASLSTGAEANPVVEDLQVASYKVSTVEKKESLRTPPPPFTTSTLQQTAANRFGWSAKRTMQLAQDLYERGLITYHRTDSTNLSEMAISMVRDYLAKEFAKEYLPGSPKFYKTKSKVAQEAHEAIRPTEVAQIKTISAEVENRDQERLYELVWKRFVACQMEIARFEETTVSVAALVKEKGYELMAKGLLPVFDGWLKLYEKMEIDEVAQEEAEDKGQLPALAEGEGLIKSQVRADQKFTQPPGRYSEAGLIKKLEELGIGRPSTYAPILSTIQERMYVEKVDPKTGLPPGKALKPTSLGEAVSDFLVANFANVVDYQFTAKMEDQLDGIANGESEWVPVIREFYEPFAGQLEKAEGSQRIKVELEETGEMCPECKEGKLVIRFGRFGKFISCGRFPDCKYKAQYVPKLDGAKCPDDGGDVVLRRTRRGKIFYGCSNWPKCKWASWTKPKTTAESDSASTTGETEPIAAK